MVRDLVSRTFFLLSRQQTHTVGASIARPPKGQKQKKPSLLREGGFVEDEDGRVILCN